MTDSIITPILAQFPRPLTSRQATGGAGEYCVGTAVCRFHGYEVEDFVGEHELASLLASINDALDGPPEADNEEGAPEAAWQYAVAITEANDDGNFDEAWRVAAAALAHPPALAAEEPERRR